MGKRKSAEKDQTKKKVPDTSGDALDDDFVAEPLKGGAAVPALDAGSEDEGGEDEREAKREKKQARLEASKQLKKQKKAGQDGKVSREESAGVAGEDAEGQAALFLKSLKASGVGAKLVSAQVQKAVQPSYFQPIAGERPLDVIGHKLLDACPKLKRDQGVAAHPPAPIVAVVVPSAARGATICDALKHAPEFKGHPPAIRAFGNHNKVKKAQSAYLKTDGALKARIVVATPGRLKKLLEYGEIVEERLCCCVLDTCPDEKQRNLLEMKETREDLFGLHMASLVPLLADGRLKICLY